MCALQTDGKLMCLGYNGNDRLGDKTTTQRTIPVEVVCITATRVIMGADSAHSCANTINNTTISTASTQILGFG